MLDTTDEPLKPLAIVLERKRFYDAAIGDTDGGYVATFGNVYPYNHNIRLDATVILRFTGHGGCLLVTQVKD